MASNISSSISNPPSFTVAASYSQHRGPQVGTARDIVSSSYSNDMMMTIALSDNALLPVGTSFSVFQSHALNSALGVVLASIILTALLGNSLVIAGVLRFRGLRTVANSFLVSLAVADLLVAVLVMPFSAVQLVAGRWPFGRLVCDMFNANDVLFSTASLLHLCCVAVDRYVAVTDPFGYDRKMSSRRVVAMLTGVWTTSALVSHVPIHFGWYSAALPALRQQQQLQQPVYLDSLMTTTSAIVFNANHDRFLFRMSGDDHEAGEFSNRKSISIADAEAVGTTVPAVIDEECSFEVNRVYVFVSSGVSFWIPATVMIFAYVKIFREARRQESRMRSIRFSIATARSLSSADTSRPTLLISNGRDAPRPSDCARSMSPLISGGSHHLSRRLHTDHKAARTLGIIMGAFIVCWLPFFTWYVASTLCTSAAVSNDGRPGLCAVSTRPEVVSTLFWVGYCNSAFNPFIYAAFNRDFRHAFHSLLSSLVVSCCRCHYRCCWCCREGGLIKRRQRQKSRNDAINFDVTSAVTTFNLYREQTHFPEIRPNI